MMHEWKSQEKLIDELDRSDPDMDPLLYRIFQYEKSEWDNLPQVIPRFGFYLQRYVRGLSNFCLGKSKEESTAHLREETWAQFPIINGRIDEEINTRESVDKHLQNQIEDLQKQIDKMRDENQAFKDDIAINSKENLLTDKFLAKTDPSGYLFEKPGLTIDFSGKEMNIPRMMTVKQIRDLFYSMINNSSAQARIAESESNINKLFDKTALLTYEDQELSNRLNQNFDSLTKSINDVQSYATNLKNDNDKRFADFFSRIQMNLESIRKLNKEQENNKIFQDMMATKTENIANRLTKVRDQLSDELKTAKNDLTLKIEETDKFFNEQVEILQASIERNKIMAKEQLTRAKEEQQKALKNESQDLKVFIGKTKDEVNRQREEAETRYEEKLKKIKEVCAQFFNKYDKQLTNYDDQMNELDKRIEDWAKLLVKPQEVNQARLFAIDTRLKETEEFRVREVSFMKDTMKKLIFALEQAEIQKSLSTQPMPEKAFSPTINPVKKSSAGEDQPLPNLMNNKIRAQSQVSSITPSQTPNKIKVRDNLNGRIVVQSSHREGGSGITLDQGDFTEKYQSAIQNPSLPNYDILYLKRLLFLKSSIDQEPSNEAFNVQQSNTTPSGIRHIPVNGLSKGGNSEVGFIHTPQDGKGGPISDGAGAISNQGTAAPNLEPRFNETFSGPFNYKNNKDDTKQGNSKQQRRAIQKSIDLQDYLNYTTGLDYRKVQVKKPDSSKRVTQTSQVSARETVKGELLDKISKNKFITDKDVDKQRYDDNEKKRQEKLIEIDQELIKQSEQLKL